MSKKKPEAPALPTEGEATSSVAADTATTPPEGETETMEEQFAALRELLPELTTAEALPLPIQQAVEAGQPLMAAYVQFQHEQLKAAAQAQQAQRAAAAAATGSLYEPAAQPQPEQAAFVKAFRTAMRH